MTWYSIHIKPLCISVMTSHWPMVVTSTKLGKNNKIAYELTEAWCHHIYVIIQWSPELIFHCPRHVDSNLESVITSKHKPNPMNDNFWLNITAFSLMCFLLMTFVPVQKLCVNIYIYICILDMSYVIGRVYTCNRSVIQYWWSCTPSHSIGLYFWGVRISWVECHFLFSLVYQLCLALCWWWLNTRMLVTFGIYFKQHFNTRYFVFYNPSPPRMFLSLELLSEYRIQHGAIGPLYVTSSFSTWILCRGVSA